MDNLISHCSDGTIREDHLPILYVKSSLQLRPESRSKRGEIISSIRPHDPGMIPFDRNSYDCAPCTVIELKGSRLYSFPPNHLQRICLEAYKKAESLLREDQPASRIDLCW